MKKNELKQIIKECLIDEGWGEDAGKWIGGKIGKGTDMATKGIAKAGMYTAGAGAKGTAYILEKVFKLVDYLTADQLEKLGDYIQKKGRALEEQKRRK